MTAQDGAEGKDGATMMQMTTDLTGNPVYKEIRDFFDRIAVLKEPYSQALRERLTPPAIPDDLAALKVESGFPLIDRHALNIDLSLLKDYFLSLLSLIASQKPREAQAIRAQVSQEGHFEALVGQTLGQTPCAVDPSEMVRFLLQETIHPVLEILASGLRGRPELKAWSWGYCPICGTPPLMGLIDADTRAKYLICGACATRWPFSRHRCCDCGSTGNVTYFTTREDERFRVETCAACKSYLKVMDQGHAALDIPARQLHLMTLHLDIIAQENGFARRAG